jgi:nucleotide-binding universal stress UspA family protein
MLEGTDRGFFSRRFQENKIEKILRHTPCDVALFRTI